MILVLVAALAAGVATYAARRSPRPVTLGDAWSSAPIHIGRAAVATRESQGSDWSVVRPLARVEARGLLTHPAIATGAALSVVTMSRFHDIGIRGFGLLPLAFLTFSAVVLVMMRDKRSGTSELMAALPTARNVRRAGMIAALPSIGALATVLTGIGAIFFVRSYELSAGEVGQGPAMVIVAGCLGVLVARWAPFLIVAAAAVPVLAMLTGAATTACGNDTSCTAVWWGPWVARGVDVDSELVGLRNGIYEWHVIYLLAGAALFGAIAIGGRRGLLAAVGAVCVGAVAGMLQLP